ncbi:MAG: hypothetical protein ABWY04_04955, partial [Arthrobacter sp.]
MELSLKQKLWNTALATMMVRTLCIGWRQLLRHPQKEFARSRLVYLRRWNDAPKLTRERAPCPFLRRTEIELSRYLSSVEAVLILK